MRSDSESINFGFCIEVPKMKGWVRHLGHVAISVEDARLNPPNSVVGPRMDTGNRSFAIIEGRTGRIQIQSQTETEAKFESYACGS